MGIGEYSRQRSIWAKKHRLVLDGMDSWTEVSLEPGLRACCHYQEPLTISVDTSGCVALYWRVLALFGEAFEDFPLLFLLFLLTPSSVVLVEVIPPGLQRKEHEPHMASCD